MSRRVRCLLAACACALALALPHQAFAATNHYTSYDDIGYNLYGSYFSSRQDALDNATKYFWYLDEYFTTSSSVGTISSRFYNSFIPKSTISIPAGSWWSFCFGFSTPLPEGTIVLPSPPFNVMGSGTEFSSTRFDTYNTEVVSWSTSDGYVTLQPDEKGFYHVPGRADFLYLLVQNEKSFTTSGRIYSAAPTIRFFMPDYTSNSVEELGSKLLDTSGSDSVASGAVDSATGQIDESFGFMQQVASLTGKFTDISADSDSVVRFPGIAFGSFSLPAQDVDIWSGFEELQTPCKVICTGVLILLWIHGVQSLYGRIFHNEVDVINDDD